VTPIRTATNKAGNAIIGGAEPGPIAITPYQPRHADDIDLARRGRAVADRKPRMLPILRACKRPEVLNHLVAGMIGSALASLSC